MASYPACPAKVEMQDYNELSNSSYSGEPPAKRPNNGNNQSTQRNNQASSGTADANTTLWQFLLDLLLKQQYSNIICWTNNEGEFKLLDAEQVAKLWGLKKNKNNMNYDKLSRALRYYYDKNIIKKVMGQKFVYKFVSFPEMVKTENRIPFKKKMESIVNESNSNNSPSTTSTAASGFQTLRPYDVKAGIIQQAQQLAAATFAQQQLMHQQAVAQAQAMVETKYQIPPEHHALYHSDSSQNLTQTHSATSSKLSNGETQQQQSSHSRPSTPHHTPNSIHGGQAQGSHTIPGSVSPAHTSHPSPPLTPVNVCTPGGSPSPAPVFDLPVSGTPTPPPKPTTPVPVREPEVKVKLEIPELDDNKNCNKSESVGERGRRPSKNSKLKPVPLSISDEAVVNQSVTSPLLTRGILPSLNTPMFLTSPMFGQRTPLIPGIHFWGPGTLSPVATLSPRLGGLATGPAFQFPAFAVSPATLASFNHFSDNVFSNASSGTSASDRDKKVPS